MKGLAAPHTHTHVHSRHSCSVKWFFLSEFVQVALSSVATNSLLTSR
jgi:hypothetical protein